MYRTLINTADLARHIGDPAWVILDCRFTIANTEAGRRDYLEGHIPGAVYLHLDEDLSDPIRPGITGRHPLPAINKAEEVFSRCGIQDGTQAVAYDAAGGALAAGRAWWLLRWLGHLDAAVLDGGWQQWVVDGGAIQETEDKPVRSSFHARVQSGMLVTAEDVDTRRIDPNWRVLDARATERYHGNNETLDPIAGHIPGAVTTPYQANLAPDGKFHSVEVLRDRYQEILASVPVEHSIVYCGSGVTATHSILAMLHAGLGEPKLYAGSWSEWITDPNHQVAT